jgi:indolepyruvate decarboxylase
VGSDSLELSRRRLLQATAATTIVLGTAGAVTAMALSTPPITVAAYILARLHAHGVDTLFGVPGATCDPLFASIAGSPLAVVVTSSDLEAGYAADGYARMRGLAAVAVTYGPGMLGLVATIAGAYAERSPVVVINGGPSAEDLRLQDELGTYFSHSIGHPKTDVAMFREVTAYAERIEKADDAPRIVDAAIRAAIMQQRPVYVEVAKHLWTAKCAAPSGTIDLTIPPAGDEDATAAAIGERLRGAARPALLLGIEIQRYGLEDAVTALVERWALPWATTFLAKSVIADATPGFVGVYGGQHAVPAVRHAIEDADVLLAIGCVMGRQYRELVKDSAGLIRVADGGVRFPGAAAHPAALAPLVDALARQPWTAATPASSLVGLAFDQRRGTIPAKARSTEPGVTYDEVLRTVSDGLGDDVIVVTDTTLAMYPASELNVTARKGFVCNAVWQSIGYSVAAAVGVAIAQQRRPLVICGDGGFQMTAHALSTMARHRLPVTVLVLDNGAYAIEQWLLEPGYFASPTGKPRPYLALNRWDYAGLARALGAAASTVDTVAALEAGLSTARTATGPTLLSVRIQAHDLPTGLS